MHLGYILGVLFPYEIQVLMDFGSHNVELCFHDHHWFSIVNIVESAIPSPNLVAIAFRVKVRMMIKLD